MPTALRRTRGCALLGLTVLVPSIAHAQSQSVLSLLPTEGRTLSVGDSVSGGLSLSDPFGPDGARMEAWSLEGRAGESVTIDLGSEEFDAELFVVGPGLGSDARDDDGGAGCDARLELTFLETGTYTVVASSTFGEETGFYTLEVHEDAPPLVDYACGGVNPTVLDDLPASPDRQIALGESASGALDGREPEVTDSRRGEVWTLEGEAGERVRILLSSDDFDTYLYAGGPGMEIMSDDDGGDDRNSRLEVQFPESGTYRIVASSFGSGQGSYTLEVLPPVDTSDLPSEGEIGVGESVTGVFSSSSPSIYDGRAGQVWELEGEAGQVVVIELRSDAFDPYLYLAGPGFTEPMQDDDGAGDLDSRIEARLPESGTYQIVVSAWGSSEGAFELSVAEGF